MSFGDVIVHLSEGNDYLCSTVAGTTAAKRSEVKVDAGKEKLVARLRETFQSCDSALAKLDDSGLSRMVPWFGGRQVTPRAGGAGHGPGLGRPLQPAGDLSPAQRPIAPHGQAEGVAATRCLAASLPIMERLGSASTLLGLSDSVSCS